MAAHAHKSTASKIRSTSLIRFHFSIWPSTIGWIPQSFAVDRTNSVGGRVGRRDWSVSSSPTCHSSVLQFWPRRTIVTSYRPIVSRLACGSGPPPRLITAWGISTSVSTLCGPSLGLGSKPNITQEPNSGEPGSYCSRTVMGSGSQVGRKRVTLAPARASASVVLSASRSDPGQPSWTSRPRS